MQSFYFSAVSAASNTHFLPLYLAFFCCSVTASSLLLFTFFFLYNIYFTCPSCYFLFLWTSKSYFIFIMSAPHASPVSFLCLFYICSEKGMSSPIWFHFLCLCLPLSSSLSSVVALSFHLLSFTVNCILSPSCLLPISLIPSVLLFLL